MFVLSLQGIVALLVDRDLIARLQVFVFKLLWRLVLAVTLVLSIALGTILFGGVDATALLRDADVDDAE